MAKGFIGAAGYKAHLGAVKMRAGYIGAIKVYSAGNVVTYYVDAGSSYQEEIDEGESCLAPKTFIPAKSGGWEFVGWRQDTSANGSVLSSKVMGDDPVTLYAVFRKAITVTYYNNSTTASSASGYRYYNNGNTVNPSFELRQADMPGWTTRGWSTGTNGNGDIAHYNAVPFTRDSDVILYGMYQQTIIVTYYNNSTTASTTSGIRYYNSNGAVVNPSFTLTQAAVSGWTARGWSTSAVGNGAISYSNGVSFSASLDITLYGMYQKTITLTYYNGSTTAGSAYGTRYYNSGSGNVVNPIFTLTPATLSGWTFRGWATSSAAAAEIEYSSISNTAFAASATVYAAYSQTITLSYNGNGSTGGSTAAQTGTRYFNSGNYSNPSFTLAANGFSRTTYNFSAWALGSASGTQYAAGASITLSASTTMYAVWIYAGNPFYVIQNGNLVSGAPYWSFGFVSGKNADGISSPNAFVHIYVRKEEDDEGASFIARSVQISTNGCAYLLIDVIFDTTAGYAKVNGQTLIGTGAKIFDISGLSSVEIEVGSSETIMFKDVYFY